METSTFVLKPFKFENGNFKTSFCDFLEESKTRVLNLGDWQANKAQNLKNDQQKTKSKLVLVKTKICREFLDGITPHF